MKPITNQPITFLTHQSIMKMKHFFIAIACLCSVLSMSTRAQAQAAGTLDASFGVGGVANNYIANSTNVGRDVIVQADGKILVASWGHTADPGETVYIIRYNMRIKS